MGVASRSFIPCMGDIAFRFVVAMNTAHFVLAGERLLRGLRWIEFEPVLSDVRAIERVV